MAPVIQRINLQQQSGAGNTPLSNQVALVSGGPINIFRIQDAPASGGEAALTPNGASFVAASVNLTPEQFAAVQIVPVSVSHQIFVNVSADGGQTWSGGAAFTISPAASAPPPQPPQTDAKPPVFRFSQSFDCLAGTVPAIPSVDVNGSAWSQAYWDTKWLTFYRQERDTLGRRGKVYVFGSSGPAGCQVGSWSDACVDRTVGGQTSAGLLNGLAGTSNPFGGTYLPGLHEARGVILVAGEINDAAHPNVNWTVYRDYMSRIYGWLTGPLIVVPIWNTVNPSDRPAVAQANSISAGLLAGRANCQIVDINSQLCDASGNPLPGMLIDNEHLDAAGANILRAAMQSAMGRW